MDDPAPTPPEPDVDPSKDSIEKFKNERVALLTEMYSKLAELYSKEKDLIIYRAIKKGYMTAYQMAEVANVAPTVIYKTVERVKRGEYK